MKGLEENENYCENIQQWAQACRKMMEEDITWL
jgi:hypothetical protein